MKKYILLAALLSAASACYAQETLYLIKGENVVAKFPVSEVDYAAFALPEGVTDITGPDENIVEKKTYISASPVYLGTDEGCGHFQIQLSTKGIMEENPPLDLLYLQISTPLVTDVRDIQIAEGTYTPTNSSDAPFKFLPGALIDCEDYYIGTAVVLRPDATTINYIMVTDGYFNVKKDGSQYSLAGMLKLDNGNAIEFSYEGPMVIINKSDEQPPADEEPLPASALTQDYTCTPIPSEAYVIQYESLFADAPNLDYIMFSLYEDSNYANCLDVALVIDRKKYPNVLLPKGVYTIFNRYDGSLGSLETGACPAFIVKGDQAIAPYGCWLTLEYSDKAPLVGGQVEVLEDITSWDNIKIKVTLTDNAETPHTVTCEYSGSVMPL